MGWCEKINKLVPTIIYCYLCTSSFTKNLFREIFSWMAPIRDAKIITSDGSVKNILIRYCIIYFLDWIKSLINKLTKAIDVQGEKIKVKQCFNSGIKEMIIENSKHDNKIIRHSIKKIKQNIIKIDTQPSILSNYILKSCIMHDQKMKTQEVDLRVLASRYCDNSKIMNHTLGNILQFEKILVAPDDQIIIELINPKDFKGGKKILTFTFDTCKNNNINFIYDIFNYGKKVS